MYIEAVPNRNSPPAILLRESFREGGKVKKRTLLNLSDWPPALVEGMRALLQGGTVLPLGEPRAAPQPGGQSSAFAAARTKDASGQTPDGLRVHSLHSLFADLATFTRNEVTTRAAPGHVMILYPQLTPLQHKAFDLLAVNPSRTQ